MPESYGQQPASNPVPPRITPASELPRLITVSQLGADVANLIEELGATSESAIIVRHGKLLAVISPISGDDVLHEAFGRLAQQLPDAAEIEADHSISIAELRQKQLAAIDALSKLDLDAEADLKQYPPVGG